jgi:formiminotetrahydrofolate cyclodeaminase
MLYNDYMKALKLPIKHTHRKLISEKEAIEKAVLKANRDPLQTMRLSYE